MKFWHIPVVMKRKITRGHGLFVLGTDPSPWAQDNGMDSPLKDGITMCQAGRLTNQLST